MKFKKCMAILMASAITVSACSSIVFAESYQETEKAKFTEGIKNYITLYQKNLDAYGDSPSASADLSVSITDTSRVLLGFVSPVDISWVNNVGISFDTTMTGESNAIVGKIYVNDYDVCNLEIYVDNAEQYVYLRIPELHNSYVGVDMAMATEGSEELAVSTAVLDDPMALVPDASVLETLLTRYTEILFDSFCENIVGDDVLSVEGVDETCKTYKGQMHLDDVQTLLNSALTTAKDDSELKTIIEEWAPLLEIESESGDIYADFQTFISDSLASMEADPLTDDGSYLASKIWVDADNNIVGREISLCSYADAEEETLFKYYAPSTDTETAFYAEINAEGESFAISGKGTVSEGKVSGTYDFMYDSVVMASVDVTDYVPADLSAGGVNGSYKLTLQPGIGEEDYEALSDFDVVLDCITNMETLAQTYALTLNMSDTPLGSIAISSVYCDPVETPDFAAIDNVLDFEVEDDVVTFVTEMDWAPILANCVAAGMPEDVSAMLDELIYDSLYGTSEEEYYEE